MDDAQSAKMLDWSDSVLAAEATKAGSASDSFLPVILLLFFFYLGRYIPRKEKINEENWGLEQH